MTVIGLTEAHIESSHSRNEYHSLQILTSVMHLIGSSILSYCISRRAPPLNRRGAWKNLTWGRTCTILVLVDSWIFVLFSGILSTGVGLAGSITTCQIAIIVCIVFYAGTKLLIYAFLVEKVYIVWSSGNQTPRFKTPVYRICCTVQLGYVVVVVLMILGRIGWLNMDRVCVLGLEGFASIPLVTYELGQNVFFTAMFLWPFWKKHQMSPRLRVVAKKTLYAACGSLTVSAINILIIIGLKGSELGWICLTSCVTDVTINAILLFWVSGSSTSSRSGECRDRFSLPAMDMTALTFPETAAGTQARTAMTGVTLTGTTPVQSPTLMTFPDEMFDYIPKDHRHLIGEGPETKEEVKDKKGAERRPAGNEGDIMGETRRVPDAVEVSAASAATGPVDGERLGELKGGSEH